MLQTKFFIAASLCLLAIVRSASGDDNCVEKETALTCMDVVEDLITNAQELLPNLTDVVNSGCGAKDKASAYLELAKKLLMEAKKNYPICKDPNLSRDCSDVLKNGQNVSGVYTIWPSVLLFPNGSLEVFCDMDTDGGGWTVIQRRGNFTPQEDFYRNWKDYKSGFGNLTKDFWLGNDNLFSLTNQGKYKIRFDLESEEGERAYAVYDSFRIEEEKANYKLHIGKYKGNAGNSMMFTEGLLFSARDRDNDNLPMGDCSKNGRGGWWYDMCATCNPNGEYGPARNDTLQDKNRRIFWYTWKRHNALAATEIKIKSIN